jgi:hypothetical protein
MASRVLFMGPQVLRTPKHVQVQVTPDVGAFPTRHQTYKTYHVRWLLLGNYIASASCVRTTKRNFAM